MSYILTFSAHRPIIKTACRCGAKISDHTPATGTGSFVHVSEDPAVARFFVTGFYEVR